MEHGTDASPSSGSPQRSHVAGTAHTARAVAARRGCDVRARSGRGYIVQPHDAHVPCLAGGTLTPFATDEDLKPRWC
jgi:hypothetical protein